MQPIFCSFTSGVHYRKTVKRHFRSILPFDLVVSIYENMPFRLFSSFLTAGNKSKCGTLQRLTGSQQSTDKPIFRPVSPPKRQAMQGKPSTLSSPHPQTSSHLRTHRTSVPSRLQKLTGTVIRIKSAPQATPSRTPDAPSGPPQPHPRRTLRPSPATPPTHPQPHPRQSPRRTPPSIPALPLTPATHLTCTSPPKFACNSRTGVIQWYKVIQTSKVFRGNCMRNCST